MSDQVVISNGHRPIDEVVASYWEDEIRRRREKIEAEVRRRVEVRRWAEKNEKHRVAVLAACERDVVRLFDDWFWTYDPRNQGMGLPTRIPFNLRPKQEEFLRWLEERERMQSSGMLEKSRDEGGSFLVLGFMLHRWLFREGFAGAVGSRKQELVDKLGDPKTLFAKIRTMLYSLPAWFLPRGYKRKDHDNFLRLINPETGSSIAGEAGDEMGRGGRTSIYFIDEWAFIPKPDDVNKAVSQNSNIRIKVTTPNGPGNAAYQERFSGQMPVFTLHWRDNPAKNRKVLAVNSRGDLVEIYPWYEVQKASPEMTDATIAQEVDIDWTASVEGVVIPAKWVQAAVDLNLEEGSVRASGLDVAEDGSDKTIYAHRRGSVVTKVRRIMGSNPAVKAAIVEDECAEDEPAVLFYDRLGVGSGITATLKHREGDLSFRVVGVANSEKPTDRELEDRPDVPANERFANLAAELWWSLRLRFRSTYERVEGIAEHADDECISIPNDASLIAELSQPTYSKNSKDKIKIDKKGEGTQSPDYAEAVMYAFAPELDELQLYFG